MGRRATTITIIVLAFSCLPAAAGKIGFVDVEKAVERVEEGKRKLAELQAWQAPHQARLDGLRDQLLALREQLNTQQGKVSAEAYAEIEKNELTARRAFEDARRTYERDLQEMQEQFLAEIASKISAIGSEYAKANDYDAIFLTSGQPLMYVAESANLTDVIVRLYNERFPVTAPSEGGS